MANQLLPCPVHLGAGPGAVGLAAGRPVTVLALDLGYDSPSAFIAAFKRAFGVTPARYFSDD